MIKCKGSSMPINEANIVLSKSTFGNYWTEKDRHNDIKYKEFISTRIKNEIIDNFNKVLILDKNGNILESNFKIEPPHFLKDNYNLRQYGLNKVFKGGDNQ